MKTSIFQLSDNVWEIGPQHAACDCQKAQLVLCFSSKQILEEKDIYHRVQSKFPAAQIAFCSTAGEIFHDRVFDNTLVASALFFDHTPIITASVNIKDFDDSYTAAVALAKKLPVEGLAYILVLSDGSKVNGSDLIKGLNGTVGNDILITGGLAGDGTNFVSTLVGLNSQPSEGNIVAIGFYGSKIKVTHGSQGGWDTFGPEREVTKSEGNNLFEIDNKNAFKIYEKYLGAEADNLPGSALLFPLSVIIPGSDQPITRTILSIDPSKNSMTFAGNIPMGSKVRFMKANFDKLTSAASSAAQHTMELVNNIPDYSLLVSCVGRKIILGPRIDEEVMAVKEMLGNQTAMAGFYSYGEISPFNNGGQCQLHNQTMTITSFYELS
jgi:hypothetical protein